MKNLIRLALILILIVPFVTTLAPAASQADKAEKVAQGLLSITDSITKAQGQIGQGPHGLNGLATPGSNPTKQYEAFATELKNTQKMANDIKKRSEQAQANRDKYLATWTEESKKIQNEQLRAASEARKAELQPTIDEIKNAATSARETSSRSCRISPISIFTWATTSLPRESPPRAPSSRSATRTETR